MSKINNGKIINDECFSNTIDILNCDNTITMKKNIYENKKGINTNAPKRHQLFNSRKSEIKLFTQIQIRNKYN